MAISTPALSALEEVIVTAQKRAQSVNDIGMVVKAFTGEMMKDLGVQDTRDLSLLVPGFVYADSGASVPVYSIRGVGFNELSMQASSTVGVYVDEVILPFPIMTTGASLDIERVEILKGPQGTLYGRNTTGGAVNFYANKPKDEFEAGLSVSYGRFAESDVEGYVSGAISDSVRARFSARQLSRGDGWQSSLARPGDTHGEVDRTSARLIVDMDPTDTLQISTSRTWWTDQSDSPAAQPMEIRAQNPDTDLPILYDAPLASGNDAREADWSDELEFEKDNDFIMGTVRMDLDLSDTMTLTSLTSYSEMDLDDTTPGNGISIQNTDFVLYGDIESFSQELRLSNTTADLFWVAGINYASDTVDNTKRHVFEYATSTIGRFTSLNADAIQETTSYAAFGHMEYQLTDPLKLTVGLRYTDETRDYEGCTRDTGAGDLSGFFGFLADNVIGTGNGADFVAGDCITVGAGFVPTYFKDELSEDNVSGRIGLDYAMNDDVLLYANVSRGFKSGSFPTLPASDISQLAPVVQEELLAYEAGFKASLLDRSMQFNASAFYYDYTDKQLLSNVVNPIFGVLSALENIPESTVKGVEFDAQWLPSEGLTLGFSGIWTEATIDKYVGINELGAEEDFAGSDFSYSPEWQFTGIVNYEWFIGNGLVASVGADVSYNSETSSDFGGEPAFDIDSYTLFNARAAVSSEEGDWKVMVWSKNLTDEYYWTAVRKSSDVLSRHAGMPRTYGVTVSKMW